MNTTINKLLVALATAIATISLLLSQDGGMTTEDWLVVATSVLGALGVYAVPYGSSFDRSQV